MLYVCMYVSMYVCRDVWMCGCVCVDGEICIPLPITDNLLNNKIVML